MSKSERTQRRYRNANRNQSTLDEFVFSIRPSHMVKDTGNAPNLADLEVVTVRQESIKVEIPPVIREESVEFQIPPEIQEESVETMIPPILHCKNDKDERQGDGWESDLDECVHAGVEI